MKSNSFKNDNSERFGYIGGGPRIEENKASTESIHEYFRELKENLRCIELNTSDTSTTCQDIKSLFVSSPTNISIDAEVKDRELYSIRQSSSAISKFVKVTDKKFEYSSFLENFNFKIKNSIDSRYNSVTQRPLILKALWKNRTIENFMSLKPIDIISAKKHCVVLGGPGSGKSTLLKYIAVSLSDQYFSNQNELAHDTESVYFLKNKTFPIYIELKDLLDSKTMDTIDEDSLMYYVFKKNTDILRNKICNSHVIFLLDGIDELSNDILTFHILNKLIKIIKTINKNSRIVFSSRNSGYESFKLNGFFTFELVELDKSCKIELMRRTLSFFGIQDVEKKSEELLASIKNAEIDNSISGSPLFLSLMIMIYVKSGNLPSHKSLVLKESIILLIERWRKKIHSNPTEKNNYFELNDLYKCLENISYVTMMGDDTIKANSLIIPDYIVIGKISTTILGNAENEQSDRSREILKCLIESVGILVPCLKKNNSYIFAHRNFQEYLAASKWIEEVNFPCIIREKVIDTPFDIQETFLIVIEVLHDNEKVLDLWNIMQQLLYLDEEDKDEIDETEIAWIAWYCSMIVKSRNYKILTTIELYKAHKTWENMRILSEYLTIAFRSDKLPIRKRIECGITLGYLKQKIIENVPKESQSNRLGSWLKQIGDTRRGVSINKDGFPDILWCHFNETKEFVFGTTDNEEQNLLKTYGDISLSREKPSQVIAIKGFSLSKYPITISQYNSFIVDGGYITQKWWDWSQMSIDWYKNNNIVEYNNCSNAPVGTICWIEAVSFCKWLSKKLNRKIRLPYETEWEYASKKKYKRYSYGEKFSRNKCVSSYLELEKACPVGMFELTNKEEDHISDMNGNVWEHTGSGMGEIENLAEYLSYNVLQLDSVTLEDKAVLKGGSFQNEEIFTRNSARGRDFVGIRMPERHGFRVLMEDEKNE